MVKGQEMELALGLPVYVTSFLDGKPRLCYPYTLENINKFLIYLQFIDNHEWNDLDNDGTIALYCILTESFRDSESDELLKNIGQDNFVEVIQDIKYISGIKSNNSKKQKKNDALSWERSINIIQAYTGNTLKDIKQMTLRQFYSLLEYVGVVVNWNYKIALWSDIKDKEKFLSDSEYPMASDMHNIQGKKRMTMSDLNDFLGGTK